jgi:hypothetical protein
MKAIFLILLASTSMMAQVTTEEEYNYLTKGYETDMKQGRGVKPGYELGTPKVYEYKEGKFEYFPFIRKETKEVAAILLIVNSRYGMAKLNYFVCLPKNNPALKERFETYVRKTWALNESKGFVLSWYDLSQQTTW